MADWFVAPDGDDANSGATWDLRKLTITALIGVAWAAGDRLLVAPGVYREDASINGSGSAVYNTGTVSVTNESTTVTGAGTTFNGVGAPLPVVAGDQLFIGNFATAADGVGSGAAGFTTAASTPFQANMVGYMIEIVGQGTYVIATYVANNSITLTDVNGGGFPAAVGALTFYVVSGEGPYEVESVTDATHLELTKPWSGPTLTTLTYQIYRPVYLIGDVTGAETDGVGGVVRITGADANDEDVSIRSFVISADTDNYWHIRGFRLDGISGIGVYGDTCTYFCIEDCTFQGISSYNVNFDDSTQITVRRCLMQTGSYATGGVYLACNPVQNNSQCLVSTSHIDCGGDMVQFSRMGGVTVKNCTSGFASYSIVSTGNQTVGTGVFVHDCLLHNQCTTVGGNAALNAAALGQIVEQHNNLWSNAVDRLLTGTAANSTAYPYLPSLPMLTEDVRNPFTSWFPPSQWDETRDNAGLYGANEDMFGVHNEVAQTRRTWGAIHNYATLRSTSQSQGSFTGSLYMEDAMEQQFVYPVKENWEYTVTVWVYLESNYAGNAPIVEIKQPGETTVTVASTGAIGTWEQLSTTFTTGANLDFINVGLKSRNTAAVANIGIYWQDLVVG